MNEISARKRSDPFLAPKTPFSPSETRYFVKKLSRGEKLFPKKAEEVRSSSREEIDTDVVSSFFFFVQRRDALLAYLESFLKFSIHVDRRIEIFGLKKEMRDKLSAIRKQRSCNAGHIDIGVRIAIDLTSILLIYVICIYVSIHETVLDRGEVKSNDLYESAVGFGEVSSKERIGRRCRKAPSLYDSLGRSEEKPIHWYSLVFNAFVRLFISVNESHHVFV